MGLTSYLKDYSIKDSLEHKKYNYMTNEKQIKHSDSQCFQKISDRTSKSQGCTEYRDGIKLKQENIQLKASPVAIILF